MKSSPIRKGERIGETGHLELWADYIIDDECYRLAYGDNGFIVSFYPLSE